MSFERLHYKDKSLIYVEKLIKGCLEHVSPASDLCPELKYDAATEGLMRSTPCCFGFGVKDRYHSSVDAEAPQISARGNGISHPSVCDDGYSFSLLPLLTAPWKLSVTQAEAKATHSSHLEHLSLD